ncbi:hypothetical protein HPC49_23365 [Pyxidicoccus fallax]|uniref:Uncharacterized protein n=1 Tax=Pyxidicoccus fallax TaxID=394095 RepID=A0A848LJK3_9BACT|nr:hypothetical protein [Pyxidicoccus fallax]NMO17866.1 hypothetical protein [Pyxidicoccus fallax]NPC81154.1 hypothetical protein [Pyxidicoccus fallax]
MQKSGQQFRKYTGSLFRSYLSGLEMLGLRAEVRQRVPAPVAKLMDTPPLHSAWVDIDAVSPLLHAVMNLKGREGVRRLGYEATRGTTLKFLKPQMQTVTMLSGKTPSALFAAMDSLCRPFFTGLSFRWTRESHRSGTLELRSASTLDTASFAAWEGTLLLLFDECDVTTGTISPAVISEQGHVGTMHVQW